MSTRPTETEIVRKTSAPKRVQKALLTVDQAQIAARAYQRFVARGAVHGRDVEDWIAAEQELTGA